jgi:hypothetical protein
VYICQRPRTSYPPPPPLHTVRYTCIQYTAPYLHKEGGGGEEGKIEPQRRVDGQQGRVPYTSQSWVENTNMTECTQEIDYLQSTNSDKNTPQSLFKGQFF